MPSASSKKNQLRRQNRRRRTAQFDGWQRTMGSVPHHIERAFLEVESNTGHNPQDSFERAPAHVVDYDESPALKRDYLKALSSLAAQDRTDERDLRIAEIRVEFPKLWGVRGKAKIVVRRWFELTEKRISLRAMQNYFRLSRL